MLLLLPTFLMGATLPVLSRFVIQSLSHLGRRVGDLYATNTLGAVLGCGAAGYYLIPALGIRGTLFAAATLNIVIAVFILALDRLRERSAETEGPAPEPASEAEPSSRPTWLGGLILGAIGFSGAAAMIYENAWTHALTLIIGGSVYSFTTMLLSFLVGLAVGGYLYARLFGEREMQITSFGLIELGVGAAALATIPLFEKLPLIFLRLHAGFGDSFPLFLAIQVAVSFLVMFPSTLLFGMTFPLVVRLFTQSVYRIGSSVGTTYAVNTVGAIIGAFAGGFILLPLLGIQNSILIGAFINLIVGWVLVIADPHPGRARRLAVGGLAAVGLIVLAFRLPAWDQKILTSGVTVYAGRYRPLPTDSLRLEEMRQDDVLYYREGLTATVSVHRLRSDYLYLKTNGKTDGSYGDALTFLLTGYIPMLLKSDAKDVAIIGLGTGMTVKAVGAFPAQSIQVLEIEPAMVEAAAYFKDKIGNILQDPRVKIIPSDGRNYMLAAPKLYDVIISEPSNPWIAGIASLFTKDFYAVARQKLKPGGLFAQWIHNYSMSPDDFQMVLRTFSESFPHVSMWNMQETDYLLIGAASAPKFDYAKVRRLFAENKSLKADFESLGLSDAYTVLGFYRMGKQELQAFSNGADLNTDDNVRLEFSAPRSLGKTTSELNRALMESYVIAPSWKPFQEWLSEARHHFFISQSYRASALYDQALKEVDRAIEIEPKNAEYHLLRGQILAVADQSAEAFDSAKKALELGGKEKERAVLALGEEFYTRHAKVIYKRVIDGGSRDIVPYLGLANIALHEQRPAEAEQWLGKAGKVNPEHTGIFFARGKLELAKGNASAAVEWLERAQKRGEESASLFSTLGQAYGQLKQWDKAAAVYPRALRQHRRNTEWRLAYARALEELGRVKEAEEKYREVLALDPDLGDGWRGLRRLGKRF
jgi:spermidine synthase